MKKLLLIAFMFLALPLASAHAAGAGTLSGYAWSSTIGWVSFNCSDSSSCGTVPYSVAVSATGALSGYAWSPNVGWISFNTADLSGCPSGSCSASINQSTGAVTGWARAVEGKDAVTQHLGGWGGWIHLAPDAGTAYGVTTSASCTFSGYAWGGGADADSGVIGWMNFKGAGYGVVGSAGSAACPGAGPAINAFSVANSPLPSTGGTPTFTWNTSGAASCTLSVKGQSPFASGLAANQPTAASNGAANITTTTTYTLNCVDGANNPAAPMDAIATIPAAGTMSCSGVNTSGNSVTWTVSPASTPTPLSCKYYFSDPQGTPSVPTPNPIVQNGLSGSVPCPQKSFTTVYPGPGSYSASVYITNGANTQIEPAAAPAPPLTCTAVTISASCNNPTATITPSATRVNQNATDGSNQITFTVKSGSGLSSGACYVTGPNGYKSEPLPTSSCNLNPSTYTVTTKTPPITSQSTYQVTCNGVPVPNTSVVVNVIPNILPF